MAYILATLRSTLEDGKRLWLAERSRRKAVLDHPDQKEGERRDANEKFLFFVGATPTIAYHGDRADLSTKAVDKPVSKMYQ